MSKKRKRKREAAGFGGLKVRTYFLPEDFAVDHKTGTRHKATDLLDGGLDEVIAIELRHRQMARKAAALVARIKDHGGVQ